MMIVAGEQAAMDNWRWHHASKMTVVPDPPFHALIVVAGSTMAEPVSHLADPSWIATSVAYAKDLAVFKDHAKTSLGNRSPPSAPQGGQEATAKSENRRDRGARRPGGGGQGGGAAAGQTAQQE